MAKWYISPMGKQYDAWLPQPMQRETKINSSLPQFEPKGATDFGADQMLYPLTDDGPTAPDGQVVDTRTVTVADGAATAEYTYRDKTAEEIAAENDPAKFPLLPWQFKAMVAYLDKDSDIRTAINAISNPLQKAVALSRYENATSYNYGDTFLQNMRGAIGMSETDLSAAWMIAKDLKSGD